MLPIPVMWIVWGIVFGASTALLGPPALWAPTDPTARGGGRLEPAGFYSWASSTSRPTRGVCETTVFAITPRRRIVRVRFDGQEQSLDWSWSHDVRTRVGERQYVTVEFLNPLGGALLAKHEVPVSCAYLTPEAGDGT